MRVTSAHWRDRTYVPAGTLADLPANQAQAMLRGGTAELVDKPRVDKSSRLGKLEKLRSIFVRICGAGRERCEFFSVRPRVRAQQQNKTEERTTWNSKRRAK